MVWKYKYYGDEMIYFFCLSCLAYFVVRRDVILPFIHVLILLVCKPVGFNLLITEGIKGAVLGVIYFYLVSLALNKGDITVLCLPRKMQMSLNSFALQAFISFSEELIWRWSVYQEELILVVLHSMVFILVHFHKKLDILDIIELAFFTFICILLLYTSGNLWLSIFFHLARNIMVTIYSDSSYS